MTEMDRDVHTRALLAILAILAIIATGMSVDRQIKWKASAGKPGRRIVYLFDPKAFDKPRDKPIVGLSPATCIVDALATYTYVGTVANVSVLRYAPTTSFYGQCATGALIEASLETITYDREQLAAYHRQQEEIKAILQVNK